MQALIDGDVLRYEIGFAAEAGWQNPGFPPFDYAAKLLDEKIANICAVCDTDLPPIIYLTGKTNFRNDVATLFKYKDRDSLKPYHYRNLTAYLHAVYDVRLQEGLEADDLMSIEQCKRNDMYWGRKTIICTRDKDLHQVPGLHYGWELGGQPSFGPLLVDEVGTISLSANRKKVEGYGQLFFYSQLLTGDGVDTVPGIEKCGPVKAIKILEGCITIPQAFKAVLEAYKTSYGDVAEEMLLQQGRCLWMTRELNEDGSPKLWEFPNVDSNS